MSAIPGFDNAIAYAHFKLRGGTRNILLSAAAYLLILILAAVTIYSATRPSHRREALEALAAGLLVLQLLLVAGYGMYTTGAAVKTDLSSHLIESHRLMPLSSGRAIAGYLIGPPSQAYTLFAANVVVGLGICVFNDAGGANTRLWLLRNGVLLLFALFLFALTIFWGALGRNIGRYIVGLFILFWISQGHLFGYLPAFYVLGSPFMGATVLASSTAIDWTHGLSALAQVSIGLILLIAAARKYRRPHLPAFSPSLGLLLLAAFAGVFGAAIFLWTFIRPEWHRHRDVGPDFQFICSTAALMALAMLPIASAARLHTSPHPREKGGASRPGPVFTAALAALICLLILAVAPEMRSAAPFLRTAVVIAAFCLAFAFLLTWSYRITTRPTLVVILWLILTWGAPLVADVIRYNMMEHPEGPVIATIAAGSPYGALVNLWSNAEHSATPGLAFQLGLLVLTIVLSRISPAPRP